MSVYKADARVIDNSPGTNPNTFRLTIISVSYSAGSVHYIVLDNIDPDILSSTLQTDIVNAVKSSWGLGVLDLVRVL